MDEHRDNEKLAYTIPEIAKLTGLSISYLYKLSSEGKLPICKIGTRCLIIVEDFNNWLRKHSRADVMRNQQYKHRGNQK